MLLLPVLSAVTYTIAAATESEDGLYINGDPLTSQAAIVIDYATGLVIYEYNADELRVPASMTKMFAVYVVFDAVRDGLVSMDTMIPITDESSLFSYNRAYSNVPKPFGSAYSLKSLLDVVIVRSASAATIALGEGIFGSEEALVARMNLKAEQLGIIAEFHDSWGGSPNNRISARSMAEMTRSFITEYPEVLNFTSQKSVYFDEINYGSTNLLLDSYPGVDGLKTGFTRPAGWCFTGTAMQEGRRIISVTMGSEQGHRFTDSEHLLDYGFLNYSIIISNYFRDSILQTEEDRHNSSLLVPISMYNIEKSQYLNILDLAEILNETN